MDIRKNDRVMYGSAECVVLWTYTPQGKAPMVALVAELEADDNGNEVLGARHRATKAELEPAPTLEAVEVAGDADVPGWAAGLSGNVIAILDDEDIDAAEALELGVEGLIELDGIGKPTAAKILEAAAAAPDVDPTPDGEEGAGD